MCLRSIQQGARSGFEGEENQKIFLEELFGLRSFTRCTWEIIAGRSPCVKYTKQESAWKQKRLEVIIQFSDPKILKPRILPLNSFG